MSDELLAYYNSELAFLRELGAEFAEKYPKVAGRLLLEAGKCADPHVERCRKGYRLPSCIRVPCGRATVRHHQPGSVKVVVTIPLGSVFTVRVICSSGGNSLGAVAL